MYCLACVVSTQKGSIKEAELDAGSFKHHAEFSDLLITPQALRHHIFYVRTISLTVRSTAASKLFQSVSEEERLPIL